MYIFSAINLQVSILLLHPISRMVFVFEVLTIKPQAFPTLGTGTEVDSPSILAFPLFYF